MDWQKCSGIKRSYLVLKSHLRSELGHLENS